MRILIADDEEIARTSLGDILKKGGNYEIDFALTGKEAIEKAKDILYDLVILDLEMPETDGYAALKQIRTSYPYLPVIFITGKAKPEKVAQSIARDKLNAFIEKPFSPQQVLDIVAKLLKVKEIEGSE